MGMISRVASVVFDQSERFKFLRRFGFYNHLSDEEFLKRAYKAFMGKELDLDNPITFNEKLQWLKLHDHNPAYTNMVDKYEAKGYITDKLGNDNYIIPTIGIWNSFDEIDFSKLPNQFVLKCTHDSGGLVIVRDKSNMDMKAARRKIEKSLVHNYYYNTREWPYKNIKPRIIAEPYIEDETYHELRDYKFFCFDGEVKALFVATERQAVGEDTKFDFFDENYNHLDIINGHPNASVPPEKPVNFKKMKEISEILSKGIPQIRVDFYEANGKLLIGELTLCHWSGLIPFEPEEWDRIFGSWITLPKKTS